MLYKLEHFPLFITNIKTTLQTIGGPKQQIAECPFEPPEEFYQLATHIWLGDKNATSKLDDETVWNILITERAMHLCFAVSITPYWLYNILSHAVENMYTLPLEHNDIARGIEMCREELYKTSQLADELSSGQLPLDQMEVEQSICALNNNLVLMINSGPPTIPPRFMINPILFGANRYHNMLQVSEDTLAWHGFPNDCCPWHIRQRHNMGHH